MLGRLSSWFERLGDASPGGEEGFCPIRGWGKVRREHPAILIRFGGVKSHRAGRRGMYVRGGDLKFCEMPHKKGLNLKFDNDLQRTVIDKSRSERYGGSDVWDKP
jgi:hypothetical protein